MDDWLFCNMAVAHSFDHYIPGFQKKIQEVNIDQLNCAPYPKRYLQHLLANSQYYLSIYAHVLDIAVNEQPLSPQNMQLIDYGAGNGLLGMFAQYAGFKQVLLCDVDPSFTEAAKALAHHLQIPLAGCVTGDLQALLHQYPNITADVMVGTDVIEHIYDLEAFFATIQGHNPNMTTVFTTASNPANPFKTTRLKRLQIKDENEGGHPSDFVLAGAEKHEAFLQIRKQIIGEAFPDLDVATTEKLCRATRGLDKPNIIKAVTAYLENGILPVLPKGYNTCNPLTSSFTERILPLADYHSLYANHGFSLQVYNGFYNINSPGIKKLINPVLNGMIKIVGRKIAPFISLKGSNKRQ